jgi:retron-type reverse transcriptase
MHHLRHVSGSNESRAKALVLVTKNDPARLGKIRSDFTDEVMNKALSWGASVLPDICTIEKTYLELLSYIGIRHAKTLQWLLIQRSSASASGSKFDQLYEKYEILKKSGKTRKISAPLPGLKRIQKSIDVTLLQPLGAHEAAFGFVKGKSIVDNAKAHTGKQVVVNADVKNCFPSVRWPLVQAALKRDLSNKLSARSISAIVDICTAEGVLPIGAPTSPSLLNRVLHKSDEILSEQAKRRGCAYSRYADDLTFSGDDRAVGMLGIAKSVLLKISLELDPVKTNIFRRGRRQMCTGLVVNDTVNVPRRIRRRIRASVHAYEQGNKLYWNEEVVGSTALRGRLEFLKMVSKASAKQLIDRFDAVNLNVKMKKSKTKKSSASDRN